MAPHTVVYDRSRMWPKPRTVWSGSSTPCPTEVERGFEGPPKALPTQCSSSPKWGVPASLPNRGSPPTRTKSRRGHRARHTAGSRGTFHEVRFLSAKVTQVVVMLVCLTNTIRSQGFSPSQRLNPTRASWLCFAPHPPIGFRPSKLFPLNQPFRLSTFVTLLPLVNRRTSWETHSVRGPCFRAHLPGFPHAKSKSSSLLVRP
jgi:hypothetical protein